MKKIEWTEAHTREALRALFRLADEVMAHDPPSEPHARNLCCASCGTEQEFRVAVRRCFPVARIEREVARVDGLATGRLVRETSERWHVRLREVGRVGKPAVTSEPMSEVDARGEVASINNPKIRATAFRVRVTRIRRRG